MSFGKVEHRHWLEEVSFCIEGEVNFFIGSSLNSSRSRIQALRLPEHPSRDRRAGFRAVISKLVM